jgi:predicted CXXCH cytochrome family protein
VLFRSLSALPLYSKYPRVIRAVTALGVALGVALAGGAGLWQLWQPAGFGGASPISVQAAGLYADAAVCAQCHPAIAATYRKSGMERSFRKVRSQEDLGAAAPASPFHHEASNTFLDMVFWDGAWYQRRWQTGFDGRETNIDEKRVDYVLGSGNHARTLLHLTERNTLQELPLGWYSEKGGFWGMNPGYDRADYAGSVRPIYYECMFCHNGYPSIPEGAQRDASQSTYQQPLPEGIECQRCHGPGQNHVDQASQGASAQVVRAAIVNPARLTADRELEVCLQCHLETSNEKLPHAIVRFDRAPFSYVPGEPLGDFQVAFDRTPGKNKDFVVAGAGYRFRQSQCVLKSAGKLRCTSCHNPHDIPRGEEAASHYNQVCAGCHAQTSANITPAASTPEHKAGANCVSCHMPRRRTDDGVHVVMTDHLIARRPPAGDLLAEKPERPETAATSYRGQVVPYYPAKLASTADNDLTVAVAQVREQSNLKAGVPQLASLIAKYRPTRPAYYAELGEAYLSTSDTASAIRSFAEASRLDPESAPRLIQWGDALLRAGQWTLAESKLRRASELAPRDPRAWGRLGWAMWQQSKAAEAKSAIEKAIGLDGEIPELHNNLGLILWGTGDRASAEKEFRAALRIQPGVSEWRLNLGRALASQGQAAEARFQMEESLRLRPENAEARVDYARVLADSNLPSDAAQQAKLAVETDPRSAAGHEIWGALLSEAGDLPGARRELLEAVRLQPGFGRAQVELAMVLLRQGDRAGALPHLTAASQGRDPEARAAAARILRGLR